MFTPMKTAIEAVNRKEPLYIDSSEVTVLTSRRNEYSEYDSLEIYNSKGPFGYLGVDVTKADVDAIAEKLNKSGARLIRIPPRKEFIGSYPCYINPAAVSFAAISKTGKDGKIFATIGVKGYGQVESAEFTQTEIDMLLAAVRSAKTVLEYQPEEVSIKFRRFDHAALYIDPRAVTQIDDEGREVTLRFEGAGCVDIRVGGETPGQGKKAKFSFANTLAAANGTLATLTLSGEASYFRPADVTHATVSHSADAKKDGVTLYVHCQGADSGILTFTFNNAADLQATQMKTPSNTNAKPQAAQPLNTSEKLQRLYQQHKKRTPPGSS